MLAVIVGDAVRPRRRPATDRLRAVRQVPPGVGEPAGFDGVLVYVRNSGRVRHSTSPVTTTPTACGHSARYVVRFTSTKPGWVNSPRTSPADTTAARSDAQTTGAAHRGGRPAHCADLQRRRAAGRLRLENPLPRRGFGASTRCWALPARASTAASTNWGGDRRRGGGRLDRSGLPLGLADQRPGRAASARPVLCCSSARS